MRETPTSTSSLPLTKARQPLKSITNTTPSTSVKSLDQAFSAVMTQDENDTTYTDPATHKHYTATGTVIKPSKSASESSQDSTIYESTAAANATTVHKPPIKRRRSDLPLSSTTAATTSTSDKQPYTSSYDVCTSGYTASPLAISPPPRVRKIKVSNEIIVSIYYYTIYTSYIGFYYIDALCIYVYTSYMLSLLPCVAYIVVKYVLYTCIHVS